MDTVGSVACRTGTVLLAPADPLSMDEKSRQDGVTRDTISEGALTIAQREEGYRFGIDAILLATDLPDVPADGTVVELGAGQGVVALCIASRHPDLSVVAVERQESLFELLRTNLEQNDLGDRVTAVRGDVRNIDDRLSSHTADLVVCNPPYYREGQRRVSEDAERAAARNELAGTLGDFIDAAQYVLDHRGRLKLIVPPIRTRDLYRSVETTDFSFETARFFHSRRGEDAYLAEYVLRRGGAPDVRVRSPLFLYDGDGEYGAEVRRRIDAAGGSA